MGEQPPHWITIASSSVRTDGEVVERVRLMQSKNKDQMRRGEQMAVDMRRSRKKSLISSKRGLFGNHTPRERSVSPMFGRLQFKGVPAADVNEVTDQENSKESNQVVDTASPRIANVQGEVHDGPARANQTNSSAGALEAPAKTNIVTSSVEGQAVPA